MARPQKWYRRDRPSPRCPVVMLAGRRHRWRHQCEMTAEWPHEHNSA